MARGRLIFLLVWIYFEIYVGGERISKKEISPEKIHLQRSQPYTNEEPGFFSKIASWIFPFGGTSSDSSDSLPSPSHQSSPHYLPPPKFTQNIEYLPAIHHKTRQYLHQASSSESSDCNPCNREPWIPIAGKSGKKTIIHFIPPQSNIDFIFDGLNPPPPINGHASLPTDYYGPPPISGSSNEYKYTPPQLSLLSNQHRPFGELNVNSQHVTSTHILPQYEHSLSPYRPPQSILLPIQNEQLDKLRPSVQYRSPNSNVIPNVLNPPPPSILPKPPKNLYGPPAPLFRSKPSTTSFSEFGVLNTKYKIKNHMVPPAVQTSKDYQHIIGMKAPPVVKYLPTTEMNTFEQYSNKNPHSIQDILQPPVSQYPILEEDFPPNTRKPLSNHGSPDIYGIEQVPLSSGDNDDLDYPIAFPNLSVKPLAPIHNFINFNQGARGGEKVESIQILPSVTLGDYISSIEYPINVIQSPLVDVNLNGESEITKLINIDNQSITYRPAYPSPTQNTIQSGLFVNPSINTGNLNEEPIVVDDTHAAASSHNETYNSVGHTSSKDDEGDFTIEANNPQTLPLNGRENIDQDLTIIENGISHSSDIIVTNEQNNSSSHTSDIKEKFEEKNVSKQSQFTQPPMDYSQWTPTWSGLSMEISPPPLQSTWMAPVSSTEIPSKKTKHVQIIIPYYNFNNTAHTHKNVWNSKKKNSHVIPFKSLYETDSYTTLLPVYQPPSSSDKSVWSDFINDLGITAPGRFPASPFQLQSTTRVYNIQDILGSPSEKYLSQNVPFDILSLQKNINKWTQQAFAKTTEKLYSSQGVIQKLSPSKKIPQAYLTTVPYDYTTMRPLSQLPSDHETAGSVKNENFQDEIGNNLVLENQTSTTEQTIVPPNTVVESSDTRTMSITPTSKDQKSLWDILQTTFSPVTKEKVYIVTPAPLKQTTFSPVAWSLPPQVTNETALVDKHLLYEHPKFSIRIEDNTTDSKGNGSVTTKVIYSEWPHKINNLQTSTVKPTSRHPLFGLMDVSVYSPPASENIETLKSGVDQDKKSKI